MGRARRQCKPSASLRRRSAFKGFDADITGELKGLVGHG